VFSLLWNLLDLMEVRNSVYSLYLLPEVFTFINAASQFFLMYIFTDRYPSRHLITLGLFLSTITFYLFFAATVWWQFLPMQIILAASWSCLYVGSLKYVTEQNVERATATGMLNSILSMCVIFGAIMGGTIASYYSKQTTIVAAALLSSISTILWLVYEFKEWRSYLPQRQQ